ncbi:hypothetical protein O0L34_g3359 [Tuta absoluta]|nr:hypothetical protein O0L34_g3359 [Tuta absoluta]
MIVVADGKPPKKVYFLDKPLLNKLLRKPMKVDENSGNVINKQFNNVNKYVLQTERPFKGVKSHEEKGYFKEENTEVAGKGILKKTNADQSIDGAGNRQNYVKHCFRNCIEDNITKTNDVYDVDNRYDYLELMKKILVRPLDIQNSENLKNTLYNKMKQRHRNNFAPYRKANKPKDHKIITLNSVDETYNEIDSNAQIKQKKVYPQDKDESDFNSSELAEQIQEINELGKQFNDEITQKDVDRRREMYKSKFRTNQIKKNRYYMKRPAKVARSSCVYPECDISMHQ